jgi:L-aspartate oxidase
LIETDVLVIGCGIAGATAALELARNPNRQVTVLTRAADPEESNTLYAQGGIVSRALDDSPELLVQDILAAGAGASSPQAARMLAELGPELLENILIQQAQIQFDRGQDGLVYGKEAAHSRSRILHVGDMSGRAIIQGLVAALQKLPNVHILTSSTAVDLITYPHHSRDPLSTYEPVVCYGAYAFERKRRTIHRYVAQKTILATGGLGRLYYNTTNPVGSRGDGVAIATRAGARIANMEYIQFHPTALAMPAARGFLISEAVRGEGGVLLTPDGQPFMQNYSPEWGDLAPRDIVARAIHHEMEMNGYTHALLDIASRMPADTIRSRFPHIYESCLKAGLDITTEPIPVVPAAHYSCGGVLVDSSGRASITNLYAVGEVSCTGLHGANRLASTSLLEGLVWGHRAAQHIEAEFTGGRLIRLPGRNEIPPWDESGLEADADVALIQGDMQTIQNIMWHYVGLVRSADRLSRAIRELRHLWNEIETFYRTTRLTDGLIGLRNAIEASVLIAQAALHNRQSRGCHFRQDASSLPGDRLIS